MLLQRNNVPLDSRSLASLNLMQRACPKTLQCQSRTALAQHLGRNTQRRGTWASLSHKDVGTGLYMPLAADMSGQGANMHPA